MNWGVFRPAWRPLPIGQRWIGTLATAGVVGLAAVGFGFSSGVAQLSVVRALAATGTASSAGTAAGGVLRPVAATGEAHSVGVLASPTIFKGVAATGTGHSAGSASSNVIRGLSGVGTAHAAGTATLLVSQTRVLAAQGTSHSAGRALLLLNVAELGRPPYGVILAAPVAATVPDTIAAPLALHELEAPVEFAVGHLPAHDGVYFYDGTILYGDYALGEQPAHGVVLGGNLTVTLT